MVTVTVLFAVVSQTYLLHSVKAQTSIDLSKEYSSGDVDVFQYLQAWYTWININGTHTIFLALHSNQAQSPVSAFVGQGYNTTSGSKVFVANALLAMEVYNDTNGNGYLDANYSASTTELKYLLIMNASQTFTTNPVQKTITNGLAHYSWGVTYGNIQAILIKAAAPNYGYTGGLAASYASIDHVSFSYDYSLNGNTTILKTSYDIGNVVLVPPTDPGVTMQGLSLSLLHTTLAVASHQLSVIAGGNPYNSQTSTSPSLVTAAQLTVDNGLTYEFRFRDNYTLTKTPPETYPARYVASPKGSLPLGVFNGQYYTPLIRVQDYVKAQLPDIAGLPSTSDLSYSTSRLIYRVSYPVWSGSGLKHDPTYVAHFVPSTVSLVTPPVVSGLLILVIAAAGIVGVFLIVLIVSSISRIRRHSRIMISGTSQSVATWWNESSRIFREVLST
jgi:hypothetical protein